MEDVSNLADHDQLTNFIPDEHINHANVYITGGGAITGGGTIDGSRTLWLSISNLEELTDGISTDDNLFVSDTDDNGNIKYGSISTVVNNADHDQLTNFNSNEHINHTSVYITGDGNTITGGGDLTTSSWLTLADTAVMPSTYGTSATVPRITIDQQGRITNAIVTNIDHGNIYGINDDDHTGYIYRYPTSTLRNTIWPTTKTVVPLTVKEALASTEERLQQWFDDSEAVESYITSSSNFYVSGLYSESLTLYPKESGTSPQEGMLEFENGILWQYSNGEWLSAYEIPYLSAYNSNSISSVQGMRKTKWIESSLWSLVYA